ncbi:MAG TPA: hypothetical protein VF868_05800 [Bacteroidia bacterium]|jgi:hypothetical protein
MNQYLYDSFRKLNGTRKSELLNKFRNSPTVIKFIGFIEKTNTPDFKTASAIEAVYPGEKGIVSYNILENRYFKLRKKVLDELGSHRHTDHSALHTEEELRLLSARELIASGNKETACRMLVELEKICWERNIFELLPVVIDQVIFCNQAFNRLEKNKELYARLEKAIMLLKDIQLCGLSTRKIYEINFTKGIAHAGNELKQMRALASKHKSYPRFLMCYHHVSAYYKLGSKDNTSQLQVVSRHLSGFKKLQAKHPLVPLMNYKVNYVQHQHMHFSQMSISFHFARCEFEEAYRVMKDMYDLIVSEDSVLKMYRTEAVFYNMITSECMTRRFQEALETVNDLMDYLRSNNCTDKLILGNVLKARIYSETYPNTMKMDPGFLNSQVDEYLKILKKNNNTMISLDQTLVLKAKLLLYSENFQKALRLISLPEGRSYLEALKLYSVFCELIRILQTGGTQRNSKLAELNKTVQLIGHKASTPAEYMHIHWLQHYIKHLLR